MCESYVDSTQQLIIKELVAQEVPVPEDPIIEEPVTEEPTQPIEGLTAIDMTYHVQTNKQKFINLAAYSNNITYRRASHTDSIIDFGKRYIDVIEEWEISSLPSNGTLYDKNVEITNIPWTLSSPNDLLYVPNKDYQGADGFIFGVHEGTSIARADILLSISDSFSLPAEVPTPPYGS